jgi:hypothetical protein
MLAVFDAYMDGRKPCEAMAADVMLKHYFQPGRKDFGDVAKELGQGFGEIFPAEERVF